MKKYCLIIICSLLLFTNVESQINYAVSINASSVSINTALAFDGNTYSNVNIANLYASGDTGKPTLPVKYIRLYIPAGKDVDNISFTTSSATSYNLTAKVFPMQKPIPVSANSTIQGFTKPDAAIYNSSAAWPSQMVTMVSNGYFDLINRIVTIAITPFQYYPLLNKLDFYSSINITVNLKQSANIPVDTVKSRNPHIQAMYADILKGMVNNPQDINISSVLQKTKINTASTPILESTQCSLPVYDYVIITDTTLVSSFANFINWKKSKGINIGIVTTNRIYNCSGYSSGDIISSPAINDNAGKVRQYLHDAYLGGTAWALIAGDYDTYVPIRLDACSQIPTDWYFADLTSNWSVSSSNPCPLSIHFPNIFVGRLICSSTTDVQNWTNKVIQYEQNPGNGDYSYLLKSFSIEADQMQGGKEAEGVASHLTMFDTTIWREYPIYWATYDTTGQVVTPSGYTGHYVYTKGSEIISELNTNHFGLISWFCHGFSSGISTIMNGTEGDDPTNNPIWQLRTQQPSSWCHDCAGTKNYIVYDTNCNLQTLTNNNYTNILYSISCDVTPFDETRAQGNGGLWNCGEAFTKLSQTGGVAFLGNTRAGVITYSSLVYQGFADLITGSDANSHIGIAEALSKYDYQGAYNGFINYTHNLIGCPETEMWTATPQTLSVITSPSDLSIGINDTVTVTINNLPNGKQAVVCLYKANDIFKTQNVTGTGSPVIVTFNGVNATSSGILNVTVTAHNYIPYQGKIAVCTFNSTPLVISSNTAWNTTTVINSSVTINSGATLTINASIYLKHDATFTVNSGATLIVNTGGKIYGGCDYLSTSAWDGTFIAKSGASVTINSW
ncbi:MAG: C25 family cysteine peptidase [Bacteroidales bacterium]